MNDIQILWRLKLTHDSRRMGKQETFVFRSERDCPGWLQREVWDHLLATMENYPSVFLGCTPCWGEPWATWRFVNKVGHWSKVEWSNSAWTGLAPVHQTDNLNSSPRVLTKLHHAKKMNNLLCARSRLRLGSKSLHKAFPAYKLRLTQVLLFNLFRWRNSEGIWSWRNQTKRKPISKCSRKGIRKDEQFYCSFEDFRTISVAFRNWFKNSRYHGPIVVGWWQGKHKKFIEHFSSSQVLNVQVPFIFKEVVDALNVQGPELAVAVPLALLASCTYLRKQFFMFYPFQMVLLESVLPCSKN